MSVSEADELFGTGAARTPGAHTILRRPAESGSGTPASGSRSRRGPAASARGSSWPPTRGENGGVLVLDEPATGLHLAAYVGA